MTTEALGPISNIVFDATGAATTAAVAADAQGRATRLLALALSNLHASTLSLVSIQDNTGTPKVLAGPFQLAPSGTCHIVLPFNPSGWGDTGNGKTLDIVSSANVRIAGVLTYQRVKV